MDLKLSTYKECCRNINLFKEHEREGMSFSRNNDSTPAYFQWMYDGVFHRIDGPAIIYDNGYVMWYFLGEYIEVRSQRKFEKWLANRIMEI